MFLVLPGTGISLASIADPEVIVPGRLSSIEGRYAELSLDSEVSFARGSLVQFQTPNTLYLGEIESGWTDPAGSHVRVLIEHFVDLERAAAIRRLWTPEGAA